MPISIRAELDGDFSLLSGQLKQVLGLAVRAGVDAAATGMKTDFVQALDAAGISPLVGRMIGTRTFPAAGRGSLTAAASVFGNGPAAQRILDNLAEGVVIVPKRGKYLAIPTQFNRKGGRRGGGVLVSPQQMLATRQAFTIKAAHGAGSLIWCLKVNAAQRRRGSAQRIVTLAFAGGTIAVGGGRHQRVGKLLAAGFVPMFVLTPAARVRHVLDGEGAAAKWSQAIPDLIDAALPNDI
jgi:hypothetical protein